MSREFALKLTNKMESSETLKPEFISTLIKELPNLSPRRANAFFKSAIDEVFRTAEKINGSFKLDTHSLVDAILESAEYGLQFGKELKQCFLHVHASDRDVNIVHFTLGLHYRGMKSRLIKAAGVTDINTTVTYQGDTFEWRGQLTMPYYIKSNSPGELSGAFSVAIFSDGRIKACHMPLDELMTIETLDKENNQRLYGHNNNSFYQGSWRNRMFEIAAMRRLYREIEPDLTSCIEHEDHESTERSKDLVMAKALEEQILQATANQNTTGASV